MWMRCGMGWGGIGAILDVVLFECVEYFEG